MIWNPRIAFWLIGLIGAIAFLTTSWNVWRSQTVKSPWLRMAVWLLRLVSIAVLLAILANPVRQDLAKALGGSGRDVVLIDTSDSMGLEKPESRFDQALAWGHK